MLLTCGFFVCGFHIAFITTHMPAYLTDQGLSKGLAAWSLSLIGLFNVIGAYSSGILGGHHPRRLLLSGIYLGRGLAFAMFLLLPTTTASVLVFSAMIGLLWLSTVPLTSGLIAVMFGTRHIGMLFGVVFLSHQIGAFIGALLGGTIYEATGSYDAMWVHLHRAERRGGARSTSRSASAAPARSPRAWHDPPRPPPPPDRPRADRGELPRRALPGQRVDGRRRIGRRLGAAAALPAALNGAVYAWSPPAGAVVPAVAAIAVGQLRADRLAPVCAPFGAPLQTRRC